MIIYNAKENNYLPWIHMIIRLRPRIPNTFLVMRHLLNMINRANQLTEDCYSDDTVMSSIMRQHLRRHIFIYYPYPLFRLCHDRKYFILKKNFDAEFFEILIITRQI